MVAPKSGDIIKVLYQPSQEVSKQFNTNDRHKIKVLIKIAKQNGAVSMI